jgi:NAD(P)-dependent dehydrogenase (short-subunit alcohol dehydrogenase family)
MSWLCAEPAAPFIRDVRIPDSFLPNLDCRDASTGCIESFAVSEELRPFLTSLAPFSLASQKARLFKSLTRYKHATIDLSDRSCTFLGSLIVSIAQHKTRSHRMSLIISSEPPSRSLAGRVAIVTGAGCAGDGIGNGRAISTLLASDGCNVVCVDRNSEWATRTADMINSRSYQGKATVAQGDVTSAEDCKAIVSLAVEKFGRLDILVNNVGIGGAPGTAIEVDMEEWASGLEINVSSMVLMTKYALPAMLRNEGEIRGSVINMGSVAGLKGGTPHLLYPTSKGAIVNMTRAMAAHHAQDGIRVNCVCPGVSAESFLNVLLLTLQMLFTPMMYAGGMTEEAREARRQRSLLGTEGSGWDCASAVVFLASDHARWITGVILPVDAGVTAAVGTNLPKTASVNGKSH